MKPTLVPLIAIVGLAGCATTFSSQIRNDRLALLGQPTRVGPLIVTPIKVVEDSRCPMNARCIWAGRAIVNTRVDGSGWRETTNLELGKTHYTHGMSIRLSSVQPEEMAGQQGPSQPYLFGFEGGR